MFDRERLMAEAEGLLGAPVPAGEGPVLLDAVRVVSLPVLSPSERLLLVAMLGWADAGRWMTRSEMREALRCKSESLKPRLRSLRDLGLVEERCSTVEGLAPVNFFYRPCLDRIRGFYGSEEPLDEGL